MPTQPHLRFVDCPSPPVAGIRSGGAENADVSPARRMAYWDWQTTGSGSGSRAVVCVHGLSRQGRDFDTLARALQPHVRVVCPDVAGRGHSDWLADPMAYQLANYGADMLALLAQLRSEGVTSIDWVGTSMGGLIGMALAAQPGLGIRQLVLNDVGPAIEGAALLRIGTYLGLGEQFDSLQVGADYLQSISAGFGAHTPAQWLALSAPMFTEDAGKWRLHYDPAIAVPFRAMTTETAEHAANQGESMLWQLFDHITLPTLLLRGATSDLLSAATAQAMTVRGPKARLVEFAEVGHAPTLVAREQVDAVVSFLLPDA